MFDKNILKYGDSIVLHIDAAMIPAGGRVEWFESNTNFSSTASADGKTRTITPAKSGTTVFTVLIYDEEGDVVIKDAQEMTSKAGFFDKFSAFFRKLFGSIKVIPQVIELIK